jgi:hypothetical protein
LAPQVNFIFKRKFQVYHNLIFTIILVYSSRPDIPPKTINKTQNYTIQYNKVGSISYGFIKKIYFCEGSLYFLVKKLRETTTNNLLDNSVNLMKNSENDKYLFKYRSRNPKCQH